MIRVNVFIQVNESRRAETLETAKELTAASLKEAGCVAYDIYESATRPDVLMICETWRDEAALSAHEASAHFVELAGRLLETTDMKVEKFTF